MAVIARKLKGGGITYYVVLRWNGKRIPEKAGGDKRYARSLNAQRKREMRDGTYQPKTRSNPTVGEYCREWMAKRAVRSKADEERNLEKAVHSRPWFAGLRMTEVRGAHIFQLIDELEATIKEGDSTKISPKYVANIYGVVSQVFTTAARYEIIAANPCRVVPRKRLQRKSKKRKQIYDVVTIRKLLEAPSASPGARVFAALAFLTGGREGEVCGLRWSDWDRSAQPLTSLTIDKQYEGRMLKTDEQEAGEHERKVPVHPMLERVLTWWWERGFELVYARNPMASDPIVPAKPQRRRKSSELDPGHPGDHHTRSSAYKMWRKLCLAAGVTNVSLHSTRHTFITFARRNAKKDELVEVISHNSAGSTIDIYTHWQWEPLCEVVNGIDLNLRAGHTDLHTPNAIALLNTVEAPGIEPSGADVTIDNVEDSDQAEEPPPHRENVQNAAVVNADCSARMQASFEALSAVGYVGVRVERDGCEAVSVAAIPGDTAISMTARVRGVVDALAAELGVAS